MRSTMVLFPWPEGPHDGDAFPLVELQHRVLDDPGLARPVAERHPVEKESLLKRRRLAAGPGRRGRLNPAETIPPALVWPEIRATPKGKSG